MARSTPQVDPKVGQNRPPGRPKSTPGPAQIDPRTGPKVDQNRPEKSTKKLKKVIEKVDFLMLRWCQDDVKMMPRWWLKNDEKLVFSKMIEKIQNPHIWSVMKKNDFWNFYNVIQVAKGFTIGSKGINRALTKGLIGPLKGA